MTIDRINQIFTRTQFVGLIIALMITMLIVRQLPELDFIVWLQKTGHPLEVKVLQFFSDTITFFSLGIAALLAIRGEFKDQKKRTRLHFLFIGLSVGFAGLASYIVKKTFSALRPYEVDPRIMQWSVGGGFSFPSGHTTEAFASAMALTLLFPSWKVAVPAFTWALLIAYTRVHLGVHFPFDILGGVIIGISSAYLLHTVFVRKTELGR
jgi:membrane-associated phospholipid phosphatase